MRQSPMPYLRSDLVDCMRACKITNFVRVANSDVESRSCCLLHTHTRLCLSLCIGLGLRLHWRRYSSSLGHHVLVILVQTEASALRCLCCWRLKPWRSYLFFLRCHRSIFGCWWWRCAQRTQWPKVVVKAFEACRLSTISARCPASASTWCLYWRIQC